MPYVHYNHTRTRDRPSTSSKSYYKDYDLTSEFSDPYYSHSTSLVRHKTAKDKELALYEPTYKDYKSYKSYNDYKDYKDYETTTRTPYLPRTYSDDSTTSSVDDYPWPKSHSKSKSKSSKYKRPSLSRALTITRSSPTHLEKHNIWSYPTTSPSPLRDDPPTSRYKFKSTFTHDDSDSPLWDFEAKLAFRKPKKEEKVVEKEFQYEWPSEVLRREKWERVDWESRESEGERDVRFRKVKRRTTDEWRPLVGFRHW